MLAAKLNKLAFWGRLLTDPIRRTVKAESDYRLELSQLEGSLDHNAQQLQRRSAYFRKTKTTVFRKGRILQYKLQNLMHSPNRISLSFITVVMGRETCIV